MIHRYIFRILYPLLLLTIMITACDRGQPKKKPPVHLVPDMDSQPKYDSQEYSNFFENGSTMRLPVEGTVAVGHLNENTLYFDGKDERGNFSRGNALPVNMVMLRRGQERYNIYCAPCHGRVSDGNGIVVKRGYMPPPTFHQERLRDVRDGYIYNVIKNGIRNMPSYAHQIPTDDRWAIIAYVRALQRAQNATMDDVPQELTGQLTKK